MFDKCHPNEFWKQIAETLQEYFPPELCQNTMAENLSFGVSKQVKSKKYET